MRNYSVLDITPKIGTEIANPSLEINGDPADRIIAATCMVNDLELMTMDRNLKIYQILRLHD